MKIGDKMLVASEAPPNVANRTCVIDSIIEPGIAIVVFETKAWPTQIRMPTYWLIPVQLTPTTQNQ